jgi:8-hydroxy-5-deazaflavin:NADPH oxidoreductase
VDVTVIGTGNIGGTVGRALAASGHAVTFGSRQPDAASGAVSIAGALAASDVVVVAIPGGAVDAFVHEHGAALAGKLVVDATNRVGNPVLNSAAAYRDGAPGCRYARAFNSLGWECLADPVFGDERADLFFTSLPADRSTVESLVSSVGLRPIYAGEDPEVADAAGRLWLALVFGQKRGRHLAFRTLESGAPPA